MTETLLQGNCLELLKEVKTNSIDLILADLPYGMTANKWDSVIPLEPLFEQYQRIIKDHGAVLLFGMGKFGASLIMNAPSKMPYRYEWIWQKTMPVGFLWSHHMPLKAHENIYVFYKHLPTYNPQCEQDSSLMENAVVKNQKYKVAKIIMHLVVITTHVNPTAIDFQLM